MKITKSDDLIGLEIKSITELDGSPFFDEVENEAIRIHFTNGDYIDIKSHAGNYDDSWITIDE